MAFSILATIAFGLFLLVVLGKYYLKDTVILGIDFGSDGLHHFFFVAGLVLLIIAVWVYPPVIAHS